MDCFTPRGTGGCQLSACQTDSKPRHASNFLIFPGFPFATINYYTTTHDEINLGNAVPWTHVGDIIAYGLVRTLIIVVAAHLIFSRREI